MTTQWDQKIEYPLRSPGQSRFYARYAFGVGASGSIVGVTGPDAQASAGLSATGLYNLTYPPVGSGGNVSIAYGIEQSTGVQAIHGFAKNVLSGTAQFATRLLNGSGPAMNPNSGDVLTVDFYVSPYVGNVPLTTTPGPSNI